MFRLFLLFTLVPTIELYVLFRIAGAIGFLSTLWLVVATGLLGAAYAKSEGLRLLRAWQDAATHGRVPEDTVISGALLLVGGVLLITPGILTDITGLLLLFPGTRRMLAAQIQRRIERHIASGDIFVNMAGGMGDPFSSAGRRPDEYDEETIEARYEILDGEYEDPPDEESPEK